MLNINLKRLLSLVLVFVMVFSMLPVSAFADETEPTETIPEETIVTDSTEASQESSESTGETEETTEPTVGTSLPDNPQTTEPTGDTEVSPEPSKEATDSSERSTEAENPYIADFQQEIERILETYLGSAEVAPEDVPVLASQLDEEVLSDAAGEILLLDENIQYALDDGLITETEANNFVNVNFILYLFHLVNMFGMFDLLHKTFIFGGIRQAEYRNILRCTQY